METVIILTEQQLECLKSGKTIPGSLHMECTSDEQIVIGFNQYQRNNDKRQYAQTLLALPHGSVRKTPRRYRLSISVPDNLGERRVGELMESESVEARNYLNALESVLNNV